MLLAFSASRDDVEVSLISVTFGNIDLQNCLRNVISLFYHIRKEISWREDVGRAPGFDALRNFKPVVAVGAESPLAANALMAGLLSK